MERIAMRMFRYRTWRIQEALLRLNERLDSGDLPRNDLQYIRWREAVTFEFVSHHHVVT